MCTPKQMTDLHASTAYWMRMANPVSYSTACSTPTQQPSPLMPTTSPCAWATESIGWMLTFILAWFYWDVYEQEYRAIRSGCSSNRNKSRSCPAGLDVWV